MKIAAFDISMTATGCVMVEVPRGMNTFHLLEARVCTTEKNATSEKVSSTVDSMRRANQVYLDVQRFLEFGADLVVVEAMSWPRNAGSSIKMALVWGALAPLLIRFPLIEVGPQDIKLVTAGKKTATKEEVEAGVKSGGLLLSHAPMSIEVLELAVPKRALREHCWDAMGAVMAAMKTQKYGLLRAGVGT